MKLEPVVLVPPTPSVSSDEEEDELVAVGAGRELFYARVLLDHLLKDPVTNIMIRHGQGLQQFCKALAKEGKKWWDEVSTYDYIPLEGEQEVDVFYQYSALSYPVPYAAFHNPDIITLHHQMEYQQIP